MNKTLIVDHCPCFLYFVLKALSCLPLQNIKRLFEFIVVVYILSYICMYTLFVRLNVTNLFLQRSSKIESLSSIFLYLWFLSNIVLCEISSVTIRNRPFTQMIIYEMLCIDKIYNIWIQKVSPTGTKELFLAPNTWINHQFPKCVQDYCVKNDLLIQKQNVFLMIIQEKYLC